MVYPLKTLRPYLLEEPFELHTDNASPQRAQQRHVSHHQTPWSPSSSTALYTFRVGPTR